MALQSFLPHPSARKNFDTSNKLCYSLKRTSSICGWQGHFAEADGRNPGLVVQLCWLPPYLIQYSGKPKQPDSAYLGAVRQRFKQWILDTCNREYDQAWLDYQHEIGLRHHLTKKNQTDQVQSVPMMPLRYLIAFIYPITATIKDFLANQGHDIEAVEKMHQAWFKSIVLQVTLWSYPYTNPGQF